jgi:hypothetical protein
MDQIKALEKYFLSFGKKNWKFEDYPLKTWKNPNAKEANIQYGAGIINWSLLVGHGETTDKAIEQLRERYQLRKADQKDVPRPGIKVPLKFVSTEKIDRYRGIAIDFLHHIFNLDYDKGFYFDGSILEYFILDAQDLPKAKEDVIMKIKYTYGIDVTQTWDEPLWKILESIKIYDSRRKEI